MKEALCFGRDRKVKPESGKESYEAIVTQEEFEEMLYEIVETMPDIFLKELNGGIHASEEEKPHPKAMDNDLWILGEYCRNKYLGRYIRIYYGSFMRVYGNHNKAFIRERLRKNVLHEFRHHLESLAGEKDLEIEDRIRLAEYARQRKK